MQRGQYYKSMYTHVNTHIPTPSLLYAAKQPRVMIYSFFTMASVSTLQHTPPTTMSLKYAVHPTTKQ